MNAFADMKYRKGYPASTTFLDTLHPRHVCWILAVAAGLKPSALIESVDADKWGQFVELMKKLGMCFSYKSGDEVVIGMATDQIGTFGRPKGAKSMDRIYLSFGRDDWLRMMQGKSANYNVRGESHPSLTPNTYKGFDVQDVLVSKHVKRLMDLARSHSTGLESRWDAESAGKALGYPRCCVDSYIRLGSSGLAARHRFFKELIDSRSDQSMPVEFWSIYHVPCSISCQPSIEIGRKYLEAIRSYSEKLYDSVLQKLRCSHLAYSVGERFLDYSPVPQDSCAETSIGMEEVIKKSERMIDARVKVEMGDVRRPFLYVDEDSDHVKLHLTTKIMGLKWIASSLGNGVLILDTSSNELYLYLKARDARRFSKILRYDIPGLQVCLMSIFNVVVVCSRECVQCVLYDGMFMPRCFVLCTALWGFSWKAFSGAS